MKLLGTRQKRRPTASTTMRKATNAMKRRASARFTPERKVPVAFLKPALNHLAQRHSRCSERNRSAHIAGVSVSAVNPEITTATATVTANCL